MAYIRCDSSLIKNYFVILEASHMFAPLSAQHHMFAPLSAQHHRQLRPRLRKVCQCIAAIKTHTIIFHICYEIKTSVNMVKFIEKQVLHPNDNPYTFIEGLEK